jgi:hypothetical protein
MTKQFHGITSLLSVAIAIIIAIASAFHTSWALGITYLAICLIAPPVVLWAYCAKCACKAHCAHVLPGRVATLFDRESRPYTRAEMATMSIALLLLIGLPQLWLWRSIGLLIAFWALIAISVAQIRLFICKTCSNVHCPLGPGQEA